jgi:D-serine deaminase-like pyridoxal phosphate-dependent protein
MMTIEGILVPEPGTPVDAVATPVLIIDRAAMQRNISKMFRRFPDSPSVRPHLKTGKSPVIARMLLSAGAKGICVAKVGEAEVMLSGGIEDILITSPVGHPTTALWLAGLVRSHPGLKIVVDSIDGIEILADALDEAGVESMAVLIDINVGQNRTGARPGAAALQVAEFARSLEIVNVIGCQGYEGHLQQIPDFDQRRQNVLAAMAELTDTADLMRKHGFNIITVTTGGTGSSEICATVPGITELQPGSFVFMDASYKKALGADSYENALFVLATVISKPDENTATLDAGWKALSVDCGPAQPASAGLTYQAAGDEHGTITGDGVNKLSIGDRVMLIPSHCDTTIALHEYYCVVEDQHVVETWPIATRGRIQ